MDDRRVTICLCVSRSLIDREKVLDVYDSLSKAGYTVSFEVDLCEKAISSTEEMVKIASSVVVACYPRAVLSLFDSLGLTPDRVIDIRNSRKDEILENFDISDVLATNDNKNFLYIPEPSVKSDTSKTTDVSKSDAWFPVIDRERCNNCGKCNDFCLFGVYSKEGKKNVVKNPRNCKNNCPACARVCPQKAIIFPKYEKSPINGGLIDEENTLSLDTKVLYSDALRMKLAERKVGISLLKRK